MILQLPPAEVRPEALPKQVWPTLKEARRAAVKNRRSLVMFIPEDGTRHKAAWDFFNTLEGMKARREAEVWLPRPGDPEAMRLLDELQLRSLPVLASLSPSGKKAMRSRLGEDCVPLSMAFQKLLEFESIPSLKQVQDWIGKDQPVEPFLAFAKDRKENLDAGAKEPHRTWLMGLLEGKDERLRNWAATRLVEANAPWLPKEPKAFPIVVELLKDRFDKEVRQGNRDRSGREISLNKGSFVGSPFPPGTDLGAPGHIPEKAPFWPAFRGLLKNDSAMKMNIPFYVLMAPNLLYKDRDWIHLHLTRHPKAEEASETRRATLFWIATDWLLAYGSPEDWDAFRTAMIPLGWDGELVRLMEQVKKIPVFWDSGPGLQAMFCEGEIQESFWDNPDACLAAWGVTREALVEFGMDKMKSKGTPALPSYPEEARTLGFSTTLKLRMVVGPDGMTKWVRPEPGYALSFFAPTGLAYAMRWRFEPARVAGVARPSAFRLAMPFALRL